MRQDYICHELSVCLCIAVASLQLSASRICKKHPAEGEGKPGAEDETMNRRIDKKGEILGGVITKEHKHQGG
jgi:hypothetical protein